MGEKLISGLTTGKKDKNIIKKHTIPIFIFTIFIVYNISKYTFEFTILIFKAVICDHIQYDQIYVRFETNILLTVM